MNNKVEWIYGNVKVKIETILKVEEFFNVNFPKDYIEIVMKNDGAYPIPNTFYLNGNEEVFNNLVSFNEDDSSYILSVFDDVRDRLIDKVIPIAEDPFGNLICFDYRTTNEPTIVFWDHEKAFNNNLCLSKICNSFSELLSMLHESNE